MLVVGREAEWQSVALNSLTWSVRRRGLSFNRQQPTDHMSSFGLFLSPLYHFFFLVVLALGFGPGFVNGLGLGLGDGFGLGFGDGFGFGFGLGFGFPLPLPFPLPFPLPLPPFLPFFGS